MIQFARQVLSPKNLNYISLLFVTTMRIAMKPRYRLVWILKRGWVLPESPRWLLALGRTTEVMSILESACKFNGKKLPPNLDKQLLPGANDEPVENVSVLDLFKTVQMRKGLCACF
ncbi:unnamed protein product [Acanthoscelides obtectus]|uniref:Uncharacterized protein n=1 Tax=Acanthoscelides obtectus TaxID=200917 RepID=A0A9P0QCV9_ACAOB|nr:unnamed protein product [Acanthoscelides obtectus]CAK1686859.1 Solute carrier family 22 member 13 [Acanthoscelides obtectus]